MKLLIILLLLITYVQSAEKKQTISIDLKIYDQLPKYNNNFGVGVGGITKGMVNKYMSAKNLPTLTTDPTILQNGKISSPNLFQDFFYTNTDSEDSTVANSGLNYPLVKKINLELDSSKIKYTFSSVTPFYPIDNLGFDVNPNVRIKDGTNTYHNNYYCISFNYKFESAYSSSEFKFTANDDTWIFLDDTLVVDMGGSHNSGAGFIDFKNIILEERKSHSIDFFTCERNGIASPFTIETTLDLGCYGLQDYCGVCGGDGGTCCNLNRGDCGPVNDLCKRQECPELNAPLFNSPDALRDGCRTPLKYNPKPDECTLVTCDPLNGLPIYNTSVCADKSKECQAYVKCDPVNGCQYQSKCNDICQSGICDGKGVCLPKDCLKELNGGKPDLCNDYRCDAGEGCKRIPKCFSKNPCETSVCNNVTGKCDITTIQPDKCNCPCPDLNQCQTKTCAASGTCIPLPNPLIDDGNLCTIDKCDVTNGNISNPAVVCIGCNKCSLKDGLCGPIDSICNDSNICTQDICMEDGTCSHKSSNHCDKGDKCKVYTCSNDNGCSETDRICPDDGECQIGYCEAGFGCKLKAKECHSDYFCLEATCDDQYGCVISDRKCKVDDDRCEAGICVNNTAVGIEDGKCITEEYDPKPFICKTAAVVSTAVVAGVVVAGAVALAAAIFGGKKGYDYWKTSQGNAMAASNANPLYEQNQAGRGENPLYQDTQ